MVLEKPRPWPDCGHRVRVSTLHARSGQRVAVTSATVCSSHPAMTSTNAWWRCGWRPTISNTRLIFKSDAEVVISRCGHFWWFAEKSKVAVMKLGHQPTTAHWSGWAFEAIAAFTKWRVGYTTFGTWHLHVFSYMPSSSPVEAYHMLVLDHARSNCDSHEEKCKNVVFQIEELSVEVTGLGFQLACRFMPISAMVPGSSSNCESDEEACKNVMFHIKESLSTAYAERIWCFPFHNTDVWLQVDLWNHKYNETEEFLLSSMSKERWDCKSTSLTWDVWSDCKAVL